MGAAGDAAQLLAQDGEHMVTMMDALGRTFDCKLPSSPANGSGTSDQESSEVVQTIVVAVLRVDEMARYIGKLSLCCFAQDDGSARSPTELLDRMGTALLLAQCHLERVFLMSTSMCYCCSGPVLLSC